jgi:RimJ/RimL family protein N-acetyltransferase
MSTITVHPVPEPYRLCRLELEHADALAQFYNSLSEASKRTFRPLGVTTDLDTCRTLARQNTHVHPARYDLLLWDDQDVVGWTFLSDLNKPPALFGLGLADEHQRKGLGRVLISQLLHWARQQDIEQVHLTAVAENINAIRLYQSFGFRIISDYVDERDQLRYYRMNVILPRMYER